MRFLLPPETGVLLVKFIDANKSMIRFARGGENIPLRISFSGPESLFLSQNHRSPIL
jgi:hypothetical protein